jgi:hypothetical protein
MKQRIGDIRNSRDVTTTQIGTGNVEQEIGAISESDRLQIQQIAGADSTLAEALELGFRIRRELGQLSEQDSVLLRKEAVPFMERILGEPLEVVRVKTALRQAESEARIPEALREVFRDLSAAISAVSGTLVLSQITDPVALTVGVPAVLAMAGFLASSKLRDLYEWISQRVKRSLG